MKKQMLILIGPGKVGKSTTVKLAFDDFLRWAIQKKKASTVHYLYLTGREVAAVIRVGRESIGIATRGDSETQVSAGLDFFASHRCKVVICAARSRGKPLEAARIFAAKRLRIMPVELTKSSVVGVAAQNSENSKIAKQMLRWLKNSSR